MHLIVSIPDLCILTYFHLTFKNRNVYLEMVSWYYVFGTCFGYVELIDGMEVNICTRRIACYLVFEDE